MQSQDDRRIKYSVYSTLLYVLYSTVEYSTVCTLLPSIAFTVLYSKVQYVS